MRLTTSGVTSALRHFATGLVLLFTTPAQAAWDVAVVASGASSGGNWVGNTWTASASGAQVLASEIESHLGSGDTVISTGSSGGENGDITVSGALSWSANTLTLRAARHITIDAALTGTTGAARLALEFGQGAVASGNGALYRINTAVSLKPDPTAPTGTATFSLKRGSDGTVDNRVVPPCRSPMSPPMPTTSSCTFLNGSVLADLPLQYRSVVVDGDADSIIWIWLDMAGLVGAPTFPYAMTCREPMDGRCGLLFPSRSQNAYFDSSGNITDLAGLSSVTTTVRSQTTWASGPMIGLPTSSESPNGIYVRFTPSTGESGDNYQTFSVLVASNFTAASKYTVIDYLVNVIPDTAPDAFTFTDQTGVPLSDLRTSDAITVAGLTNTAVVSVTGGEYEINGSGTWTTADGSVANGDMVKVRHTSSASFSTGTDTTLTIGSGSDTFTSTTLAPVTSHSGPTGNGTAIAELSGGGNCGFTSAQFVPLSTVPEAPPPGLIFPHGLFEFTVGGGCTPGSTVTLTITYSQALPVATEYLKYGPTPSDASPHWYVLPASIAGNTATLVITDGELGDDDLEGNGTIVDQGGPAFTPAAAVPTLSAWGLVLASCLLCTIGLFYMRHPSQYGAPPRRLAE